MNNINQFVISIQKENEDEIKKFMYNTPLELDFLIERLKVFQELRLLSNNCHYIKHVSLFEILYNDAFDQLYVSDISFQVVGGIYFNTEEQALKAIKIIGEDKLKEYYFMVEK